MKNKGWSDRRERWGLLEELKRLIPDIADDSKDELLTGLLEQAEEYILAYCNRVRLPESMRAGQVRLALLYYNRMGIEGESAHGEGGVTRSVSALPEDLRAWLDARRLLKAVCERQLNDRKE